MARKIIDGTGAELLPGEPERCQGNGQNPAFECCCDECDYFIECFPEWEAGAEVMLDDFCGYRERKE